MICCRHVLGNQDCVRKGFSWALYPASYRPGGLKPDVLPAEMLEHPGTAAEQHGYEVDRDLVDEPCPYELLPDLSPAHHGDVLLPGCRLRLLEGALDPVGHEGVDAPLGYLLRLSVGDYEHRNPSRT